MSIKGQTGPITAIVVTVAVVVWMVIGNNGITTAQANEPPAEAETIVAQDTQTTVEEEILKTVRVTRFTASEVPTSLRLSGTTRASETLSLQANYAGKVTEVFVQKGERVKKGQKIISIDTRALRANIQRARAQLEEKKLNLEAAKRLANQQLSSKVSLAAANTALADAEANLQNLLIDLENADTKAPFAGIINDISVNTGQHLTNDQRIAELVAIDPLTIYAQVPQTMFSQIHADTPVTVKLSSSNNPAIEGNISFINRLADEGTRSVGIEVDIPNPGNLIPAGVSATMQLQLATQSAHAFSPALLTLDDSGNTAVKILQGDVVAINPVFILRSERHQVWVTGLPEIADVITVGQGFVSAGEKVAATYIDSTAQNNLQ